MQKEFWFYLQCLHVYNSGLVSKVNKNFDEETSKTTGHLYVSLLHSESASGSKPTKIANDILHVTGY